MVFTSSLDLSTTVLLYFSTSEVPQDLTSNRKSNRPSVNLIFSYLEDTPDRTVLTLLDDVSDTHPSGPVDRSPYTFSESAWFSSPRFDWNWFDSLSLTFNVVESLSTIVVSLFPSPYPQGSGVSSLFWLSIVFRVTATLWGKEVVAYRYKRYGRSVDKWSWNLSFLPYPPLHSLTRANLVFWLLIEFLW